MRGRPAFWSLRSCLLLALIVSWSCSGAKKSLDNDEADDVVTALVGNDSLGSCLVLHELLFQATSKRSEGGEVRIDGYDEARLSVYETETGRLIARKGFGGRQAFPIELLGWSAGRIWLFSGDPALGLHSRLPRTLEVDATQERIFASRPGLAGSLARPEWHLIRKLYAMDEASGSLVVTDNGGTRYAIDPESLEVRQATGSSRLLPEGSFSSLSQDARCGSTRLRLVGEPARILQVDGRAINPDVSFLDGSFLVAPDRSEPRGGSPLLQPDPETFFVLSRSSMEKDARLVISLLRFDAKNGLNEAWRARLDDLFFDPSRAKETHPSKVVFSKGNPRFRFQFFAVADGRLIAVYMLRAQALDIHTGRVIWKRRV